MNGRGEGGGLEKGVSCEQDDLRANQSVSKAICNYLHVFPTMFKVHLFAAS